MLLTLLSVLRLGKITTFENCPFSINLNPLIAAKIKNKYGQSRAGAICYGLNSSFLIDEPRETGPV